MWQIAVRLMKEIVPEFKSKNSRFEEFDVKWPPDWSDNPFKSVRNADYNLAAEHRRFVPGIYVPDGSLAEADTSDH